MGEPSIDRTGPLAQVELREEWLVLLLQGREDVTNFFAFDIMPLIVAGFVNKLSQT